MTQGRQVHSCDPSLITVLPDRQRQHMDISDLLPSMAKRQINPIVVTPELVLVAGERRLRCCQQLGRPVDYITTEQLTKAEAREIELEENVRRKDLTWQEETKAIWELHNLYADQTPGWSQRQTADQLGLTQAWLSMIFRVARDLGNPVVATCGSIKGAYDALARVDSRKMADAVGDVLDVVDRALAPSSKPAPIDEAPPLPEPDPLPILLADFLQWAPTYSGPQFSFIHCDFPYGINLFRGGQSGKNTYSTYDDHPDIYWALIECLCQNLDQLMGHSGHVMFWLSMNHYDKTREMFRQLRPDLIPQKFPLIWHKSDNVGLLPDPSREPRRVYEVALVFARGDRKLAKAVSNCYSAPTDAKSIHPSTKPAPVLKHFFQLFVDHGAKVLDPTCGSGTSILAAEALGGEALGLEIDPKFHEAACSALRFERLLRRQHH